MSSKIWSLAIPLAFDKEGGCWTILLNSEVISNVMKEFKLNELYKQKPHIWFMCPSMSWYHCQYQLSKVQGFGGLYQLSQQTLSHRRFGLDVGFIFPPENASLLDVGFRRRITFPCVFSGLWWTCWMGRQGEKGAPWELGERTERCDSAGLDQAGPFCYKRFENWV